MSEAPVRRTLGLMILVAMACGLVGCGDGWGGRRKSPVSAVWLAANTPEPEASQLSRLAELGVTEVFLEAARLDAEVGTLDVLDTPTLPPATPTTLVISGRGQPITTIEARAETLAAEAHQLRFAVEGRGAIPVGVHFELHAVDDLTSYGRFLAQFRKHLDKELFLSAGVRRAWLEQEGLSKVTAATDFVVAHLYGQVPREREDPTAWDFIRLEQRLHGLDALGGRYLVGLTTLGMATLIRKDGTIEDRTTMMALPPLLWDRRLKLRAGFSLEGVNRQVYTVVAERSATVGAWSLRPGDQIRVVRPVTSHVEEFERLRGAWNLNNLLGQVYYRVPRPGEDLSLSVDNLVQGLEPSPASPVLEPSITLQRGTGRGWLFRVDLTNTNGEVTEMSLIESNYLEISTDRGRIGRVDVGDFYRFVLFRKKNQDELEQTFRNADTLRVYLPIIEGHQTLTSGNIEVLSPGREPALTIRGSFILTDGRTRDVGPLVWRNGRLSPVE